ncbi:hypothetical protein [Edaphobacter modestus]|uniref:Uncharacterized protein n=1 Tax=Edaphobacter modestus TaxID=388466 RepID=A0A4Q7YQ37_9BACT|nr:hypothetical protein [Edaphobacter modestus]RZU39244.1 hypothetical protein BDD14_0601 [Edaphobacter modestus]
MFSAFEQYAFFGQNARHVYVRFYNRFGLAGGIAEVVYGLGYVQRALIKAAKLAPRQSHELAVIYDKEKQKW